MTAKSADPNSARSAWNELVLWAPPAILAIAGWKRRWVADDAFIDLRVVDNLLHGLGPVFNAGERVEAYTSPVWVGILAVVGGVFRLFPGKAVSLEWAAVLLGLVLAFAALGWAAYGARRLWGIAVGSSWLLPMGMLAVACVAPFWDFATSGLECSLVLAWLAASFRGSVELLGPMPRGRRLGLAVLFGLGPLVRPDLAVASGIWIALLAIWARDWRERVASLATALALPAAYEIFRMGYFAALVPNTAIAKEAGLPYWSQGRAYLVDFADPYHLWLGLALFAAALAVLAQRLFERGARRAAAVAIAPAAAGLLQALFVVRVGGDFMHARMLLPPLFAIAMPAAVLAVEDAASVALSGLTVAYAASCLFFFRLPYERWAKGGNGYIGNEREIYVQGAKSQNPVEIDDYHAARWETNGKKMAAKAEGLRAGNSGGLFTEGFKTDPHAARLGPGSDATPLIAFRPNVGEFSYAAGPLVFVCDPHGLPDPIGSRMRLEKRAQPGHEKWAGPEWCAARKLAEDETGGQPKEKVDAARAALGCGELGALMRAVDEPMSLGRFWKNIGEAARLTKLRIPQNPVDAEKELCEGK